MGRKLGKVLLEGRTEGDNDWNVKKRLKIIKQLKTIKNYRNLLYDTSLLVSKKGCYNQLITHL